MTESEKEVKTLLMRVKEESEKVGVKLNIQKTKIMASSPITSWQTKGGKVEAITDFIFLGSKNTTDRDCRHEIRRCLLLGRKAMTNISSVQSLRHVRLFATPWIAARQTSLYITNSWSSPKLMCIKSMMPSNHLLLCRPLFLLSPIPPSIRVFSNESTLHMRWPKYWSFSFRLVSFRMDWLDLLAVQGTRKSLLQHHSSKASILWRSAFFTVQLHIHTWPLEKP